MKEAFIIGKDVTKGARSPILWNACFEHFKIDAHMTAIDIESEIELDIFLNDQIDNPKFLVSNVSGPEHKKLFEVKVKIGNNYYPSGIGSYKKTAEQQAAQLAIDSITD